MSTTLNLAIIICDASYADFYQTNAICCPAVLLMWIKMFYYLRIFPQFQTLVRLVVTVMTDMISFLFVFFIAIFAFANAFYILGFNKFTANGENYTGSNFVMAVIYSYRQALG